MKNNPTSSEIFILGKTPLPKNPLRLERGLYFYRLIGQNAHENED